MRATLVAVIAALGVAVTLPVLLAHQDGPMPGVTGGFGEPTCARCHFDNRLNDPAGSLRLDGVPVKFRLGTQYRISVVVMRSDLQAGGFQLSARFSGGARAGRQAGRLRAMDESVRIVTAKDGPAYAQHTTAGSLVPKPGMARWVVEWTAPAGGDAAPVVFDVAANASNADQSALGDYIYTAGAMTAPATAAPRSSHRRGSRDRPTGVGVARERGQGVAVRDARLPGPEVDAQADPPRLRLRPIVGGEWPR